MWGEVLLEQKCINVIGDPGGHTVCAVGSWAKTFSRYGRVIVAMPPQFWAWYQIPPLLLYEVGAGGHPGLIELWLHLEPLLSVQSNQNRGIVVRTFPGSTMLFKYRHFHLQKTNKTSTGNAKF